MLPCLVLGIRLGEMDDNFGNLWPERLQADHAASACGFQMESKR